MDHLVLKCHPKTQAQVTPRDTHQGALVFLHQCVRYLQQMRLQAEEEPGKCTAQITQELFLALPSGLRMKNEFSSQATIHLSWLRSAFAGRIQAQTPLSPANFLC